MAIIGIDLGTTTSEIAYIKGDKPVMIINDKGSRMTPSVVGIGTDGNIIIGEGAKRQMLLKKDKTVSEVKRLMGTNQKVLMDGKEYLPEQISAMTLKYLKKCAEDFLGEKVTEAVITVPAQFNDLQRSSTKAAGEIAGLKVERIINEPTAAALAYGIENIKNEEKILVYDLGGGTLDVSILEMFGGILEVKTSQGDNFLGGKDFDEKIMEYLYREFYKQHQIDLKQVKNLRQVEAWIKDAAERAKIDLSSMETTEVNIPFVTVSEEGEPLPLQLIITRRKFEELTRDLIKRSEDIVNTALEKVSDNFGYKIEDIDVVLPVGGASRMPVVKKALRAIFGDRVKTSFNPDEMVAMGAAIQAGIKSGSLDSEKSILISDLSNYTLGISITTEIGGRRMYDVFDPLIMKDTPIPCSKKSRYWTTYDGQDEVTVSVYQGEARLVADNEYIGGFKMDDVPEGPVGQEAIDIEFNYDVNSMLKVDAVLVSTGKKMGIVIDTNSMSSSDINESKLMLEAAALGESGSFLRQSEGDWKKSKFAGRVEVLIKTTEQKMDKISSENKQKIQYLLSCLKKALISENEKDVDKYDYELTDLLFDLE